MPLCAYTTPTIGSKIRCEPATKFGSESVRDYVTIIGNTLACLLAPGEQTEIHPPKPDSQTNADVNGFLNIGHIMVCCQLMFR